ncbi:hypothetical protein QJS04_geneDACA006179 [Acorus gramineus]|uniref:Uncharacterized protein n=1 Tax=Acorus gramineus TaxID=55184 RepID=A0AAV9B1A3_ACOGR|nr:hypothetical protein QJS04_geneDACA006179 [Acorus gramineus]
MVHSAFDTAELIRGCPSRIDCVAIYGSKIILGTSDGYLRIYASSTSSDASDDGEVRRGTYVVDREVRGFWKRSPAAMEVCGRRELLLSLSESVAFHRLPNLEAVAAIAKTKGANAYGWDDRRGLLCVARQKRITIFRHDGSGFRGRTLSDFVDRHEPILLLRLLEQVGGDLRS